MIIAPLLWLAVCQLSAADQELYRRASAPDHAYVERRESFERLLRVCSNDSRLYGEFASLLLANRDFKAAVTWSDKGLRVAPDDAILNLRKGEALVALGEPPAALIVLAKAPLTGESQFFRGLAYQLTGDHPAARDCFNDAWQRGNDDAYVLYSLISEDREVGDKAAGLEHFKTMLQRFPDSAWLHILLGDAHFQKSEEAEARTEYLAAAKQMPELFEANFRLAYLAFEAGENAAAEQYYRRALEAKPHHTEANVYLGEALRREGKPAEAVKQLRHAIELDPQSSLAYDSLAKSLTDEGHLPEASAVLEQAEKKFPMESAFPAMRARVLTRLGKPAEAKVCAARAAAIIAEKNKKVAVVPAQ